MKLKTFTCNVEIQRALLADSKLLLDNLKLHGSRFAIIADHHVASLYGQQLCATLSATNVEVSLFSFPAGEKNKTRQTKEFLEDRLFERDLGRDTCLIALGGGVTMDLGAYIAATYCRGVPLILMPTTLLGMVDASIGGKAGVNVPYGKNLVGCLYHPKHILIDPSTLQTLPLKELKNGFVEMIKHALIADSEYFEFLQNNAQPLLNTQPELIEQAIFTSCQIKKSIVEKDERETGLRRILNFGHTVGHALEVASDYELAHGEAVAIGMLVESYLSKQLGHLEVLTLQRIHKILSLDYDLPLKLPSSITPEKLHNAMKLDKKGLKGRPRFVLLKEIGSSCEFDGAYCSHVEENFVKDALSWMFHDLCRH